MNNGAMLYWIQRKKTVLLHEIAVRYHGSRKLMQHTAFLFKRIVQGLDFQNPDPFKQQGGENHGDNLCKGNRPPYHGQTGQYGEKVCRRKDHQELSRRRYDQAVDTISQSLKNRAYNDTVPGKDKAQADDTQRGHPDLQHMLGSVEKAQKLFWKYLEHGQPNEHDAHCQADAQLHGGFDPFSISGAVIVGDNRDHAIVKPEYRHEDKALQLKINAEHRSGGGREHKQDLVHSKYHDGTDGLHDDRRHANLIDGSNNFFIRAESFHIQIQFFVFGTVKVDRKGNGNDLPGHCGDGGSGYLQPGKSEQAEDQDGIHDNIDDRPDPLRDHGIDGLSGGLQETFQGHLHKDSDGEDADDRQILSTIGDDLFIPGLQPEKAVGAGEADEGHEREADKGEKDSVFGGPVRVLEFFLPQIAGEQGIDPHAGSCGNGNHQALNRKRERHGGQCIFIDLGHENTVHNIVQRLYQHG